MRREEMVSRKGDPRVGHLCHNMRAAKNVNACIHGATARKDNDGPVKHVMGHI
jgi:hypothetical protein